MEVSQGSGFFSSPQQLARMLESLEELRCDWSADELPAIYRHQLSAPITGETSQFEQPLVPDTSELRTFGDVLFHPQPPLDLLVSMKEFAKLNGDHPDSALPKEVARALYYLSIVVALVRHRERISRLETPELEQALRWLLGQSWVDQQTQEIAKMGLAVLADRG